MIFYGNFATLRCWTQVVTFNSNLLENVEKFWFFILPNKKEVRPAQRQINIILLPNIRMISTLYEKLPTGLAQIAKLEILLKNANLLLTFLNFEVQFPVWHTTDSSEQCFPVSLKHSQHYLALYGKINVEFVNLPEQIRNESCNLLNKYSNIATTTLQSSHQMNIRFDCKVSRLSEVFGMDEIGIFMAIVPRLPNLIHAIIMGLTVR